MKNKLLKRMLLLFLTISIISIGSIATATNKKATQKSKAVLKIRKLSPKENIIDVVSLDDFGDEEKIKEIRKLIEEKKYEEVFEKFYQYYPDIAESLDDDSADRFVNSIKNENEKIKNINPKLYKRNIEKFNELEISPVIMSDEELERNNKEIEAVYFANVSKEKFLKEMLDIQEEYYLNDLNDTNFIINAGFTLGKEMAEFDTAKRKIVKIYYESKDKAFVATEVKKLSGDMFLRNKSDEMKIKNEIAEKFKNKTGKTVEEIKMDTKTKQSKKNFILDYAKVTEEVFKEHFSKLTKKDYENENNYSTETNYAREVTKQNGKWKWDGTAFD